VHTEEAAGHFGRSNKMLDSFAFWKIKYFNVSLLRGHHWISSYGTQV